MQGMWVRFLVRELRSQMPWGNGAPADEGRVATQLQKAVYPRAHAPQQEKSPQGEAHPPQLERSLHAGTKTQHSQEEINKNLKNIKKTHNIASQMGEGKGGTRYWSSLLKAQGSKGNGPHYSSMELTSLAPAKTRQISEMTVQIQSSSTQNHSCCNKCDSLASANYHGLSP